MQVEGKNHEGLSNFGKSRRKFLKNTAIVAGATAIVPFGINLGINLPPHPKNTFSVFGLHDTPNVGGSSDVDLAVADLQTLEAKFTVVLDPSEEILIKAKQAGIEAIVRWYTPGNRYEPEGLQQLLTRVKKYQKQPVVQPFNEVNLPNKVYREPASHIKEDFVPALKQIHSEGGLAVFTPLGQHPDYPSFGYNYLYEALTELKRHFSPEWLSDYVTLGLHNYIFSPDTNPWTRVIELNDLTFSALGRHLPIHITEAGLYQDKERQFRRKIIAAATKSYVTSEIPQSLHVESVVFWLLSNFAQRPADHQKDSEAQIYEIAAWRAIDGVRDEYLAVQNLTQY